MAILQSGHGGGPGDSEAETEAEQCKRVPEWMSILWLRPAGTRAPEAGRTGLRMEVGTFIQQLPSSRLPGGSGAGRTPRASSSTCARAVQFPWATNPVTWAKSKKSLVPPSGGVSRGHVRGASCGISEWGE